MLPIATSLELQGSHVGRKPWSNIAGLSRLASFGSAHSANGNGRQRYWSASTPLDGAIAARS